MLHTCIMTVRYDFSLRAANIVATKVCQYTEWFRPTHVTCFSFVSYWVPTLLRLCCVMCALLVVPHAC